MKGLKRLEEIESKTDDLLVSANMFLATATSARNDMREFRKSMGEIGPKLALTALITAITTGVCLAIFFHYFL